jgi:hypothetical protein
MVMALENGPMQLQLDLPIVNLRAMTVEQDVSGMQLQEAYESFVYNKPAEIPFIIWLLENPGSPIALPGSIDLYGHDCIHLLLNRGMSNYDEAFVIGFTMGNATGLEERHLDAFRVFARFFYPKLYRFNPGHLRSFDLGVAYGRAVESKNIHQVDFKLYERCTIHVLREQLGISLAELQQIWHTEKLWVNV